MTQLAEMKKMQPLQGIFLRIVCWTIEYKKQYNVKKGAGNSTNRGRNGVLSLLIVMNSSRFNKL